MNIQIFEKLIEIITPSFNRKRYQERHIRLKYFFEERKRIQNLDESEDVKNLLVQSAISGLTGTKYADIDEFDYFVDKFKAHDFENLYWAFVWNRPSYQVLKNSSGKVLRLKPSKKGKRNIILFNFITIFFMSIAPFVFRYKFNKTKLVIDVFSPSIIQTLYVILIVICGITIIKLIHDWYHWGSLNQIIKNQS